MTQILGPQGVTAIKKLTELLSDQISNEQHLYLKELGEYLVSESGAWALGEEHLDFISLLLRYLSPYVYNKLVRQLN